MKNNSLYGYSNAGNIHCHDVNIGHCLFYFIYDRLVELNEFQSRPGIMTANILYP